MSHAILALKRAHQAVRLSLEARLRSKGVTVTQFEVLRILLLTEDGRPPPAEGVAQRAIQAELAITSATLTRLLAGMERRDLVSRSPSQQDSRGKRVKASAKAKKLFADLMKEGEASSARIFHGFSKKEMSLFTELMQRVAANLKTN
jgi:DNA-binding MarR family transcriptional regulator